MTETERKNITEQAAKLFYRKNNTIDCDDFDALVGAACGFCDEGCPFIEQCEKNQLCYGCEVWELSMGEDL